MSIHQILRKFTGGELIAKKNWGLHALLATIFKDTEFESHIVKQKAMHMLVLEIMQNG